MSNSSKMLTILATIFLDMLGISILIPVYPLLISAHSTYSIIHLNEHLSYVLSGFLIATYPLFNLLASPFIGNLADKFGRKQVLLFSIAMSSISYLIFMLAVVQKNIYLLFLSRVIDGISGSNITIAQVIISDLSIDRSKQARNFGFSGMAIGLAFVIGPAIGGVLADSSVVSWFNPATPFMVTFILSVLNVLLVAIYIPDTIVHSDKKPKKVKLSLDIFSSIFKEKIFRIPLIANFLFNIGFNAFTAFWSFVLYNYFFFRAKDMSLFFSFMGFLVIISQGFVVRRLSGKVADSTVVKVSLLSLMFVFICYYAIPVNASYLIYVVTVPFAIFTACTRSFMMSLISGSTDEHKGKLLGVNNSLASLARLLPALLAAYVAYIDIRYVVILSAFVLLLAASYFIVYYKRAYENRAS